MAGEGPRVGHGHIDVTVDGDGINEEIVDSVDEAGPGVERAGKRHGERYGDRFSEGFLSRMKNKFGKKLGTELNNRVDREGSEAGDRLGASMIDSLRKRLDGADDLVARLTTRLDADNGKSHARWSGMAKELRLARDEAGRLERSIVSLARTEGMIGGGVSGNRRKGGLTGVDDWLLRSRFRNNALNILAKGLGGVVRMFEMGAIAGGRFVSNMKNAEKGVGILGRISAGFGGGAAGAGGMFSKLAASGPGAAIAIGAVTVAMSIMASVVGALLGLITAMAATITAGLTIALGVLAGTMMAVVAAGGLLTAAFMSMTDAQKKSLKDAFQPLKAEMVGIAQIMLEQMVPAFDTWSANLQKALMLTVPVAGVMGQAFADAGNILTKSFSGPGFQAFATAMGVYLPGIVRRLTGALGAFLNGTMGMFAALMPTVSRFAGYLEGVALRFSNWANSTKGQNAIVDFAARAMESLQALWNFTREFFGFLFDLLLSPEAMTAGNAIFNGMADAFANFRDIVARASANGDLKRWFDDAVKFGSRLWGVIEALGGTFIALYNSGTIGAISDALEFMALVIRGVNKVVSIMSNSFGSALSKAFFSAIPGMNAVVSAVQNIGSVIEWTLNAVNVKIGSTATYWNGIASSISNIGRQAASTFSIVNGALGGANAGAPPPRLPSMPSLQDSGMAALNATSIKSGGYKRKSKWKNPWTKWANSLIKEGPSVSSQIKNAILTLNKQAAAGVMAASREIGADGVQGSMTDLISSIKTGGEQSVNTARSALNSAASSLASATTKSSAKRALRQVRKSQADLRAALTNQRRINNAAKILDGQKILRGWNVNALLTGVIRSNTTLAEFAEARKRLAESLEQANQKLQGAIQVRDDYSNQVSDSIKTFGSLMSAQASVIDGVEQALSANDITSNLEARLEKIKTFQDNLRILLAEGLSNDAYKQLVDAGVEEGSAFADALIAGGNGAIQNVNSLVGQINNIADTLGTETSSRLYQAGVDAAQGLVDGLNSLSAQLDAAATRLGTTIAASVKRSLGIKSPSKVGYALMGNFGDGMVGGLDDQHVKVGSAADRLAQQVAVSASAVLAAGQSGAPVVSGNTDQRPIELNITTPTEDPYAVGREVINELVGRL